VVVVITHKYTRTAEKLAPGCQSAGWISKIWSNPE
jgi:hypothetical protein